MKKKIVVFDLDGTLAKLGKGIKPKTINQLRQLEEKGILVALCSGKTAFYLSGLLRQVSLRKPIIIGENGAEMKVGIDLPPKIHNLITIPKKIKTRLLWLEKKIKSLFNDKIYFQHNRYSVSPFPSTDEEFEIIEEFINKYKRKFKGLKIYRHSDCIDIAPASMNKKEGLLIALKMLKIKPEEMIAVGDGENDYPMFEIAGLSIGVNVKDKSKVDVNFNSIDKAMEHILSDKVLKN